MEYESDEDGHELVGEGPVLAVHEDPELDAIRAEGGTTPAQVVQKNLQMWYKHEFTYSHTYS